MRVRTVPVLVLEDGAAVDGTDRILDYLAELRSAECASTPSSRELESLLAGVPMS
jgi:glutathione S-transferase